MADFNVRSFLERNRAERLRKVVLRYAISAIAALAVLCTAWELLEKSRERVVPRAGTRSAHHRELEIQSGPLDPDGPLLLRTAIDPAPVEVTGEHRDLRLN